MVELDLLDVCDCLSMEVDGSCDAFCRCVRMVTEEENCSVVDD